MVATCGYLVARCTFNTDYWTDSVVARNTTHCGWVCRTELNWFRTLLCALMYSTPHITYCIIPRSSVKQTARCVLRKHSAETVSQINMASLSTVYAVYILFK